MKSSCVACGHGAARPGPYSYEWRGRTFRIYRCPSCTHQFVHPPVTPADQEHIYRDAYFERDGDWAAGHFGAYEESESDLRPEADQILSMIPATSGRLLDIGCAGGVFLDEARSRGFEVAGIEINASMAESARRKYGLDVTHSRIEDISDEDWLASFDVVTLLDVLEHVPEPKRTLEKVARWTKPGGVVFIRGPLQNWRSARYVDLARRILHVPKVLDGYPLDANVFNKRSLGALLEVVGFGELSWIGEVPGFANLIGERVSDGMKTNAAF